MVIPAAPLTPPPDDDRPVMGDHPDLETDETVRPALPPPADSRRRLLLPGLVVLVGLVLVVVLILVF